jgi:hypothetical protein
MVRLDAAVLADDEGLCGVQPGAHDAIVGGVSDCGVSQAVVRYPTRLDHTGR